MGNVCDCVSLLYRIQFSTKIVVLPLLKLIVLSQLQEIVSHLDE